MVYVSAPGTDRSGWLEHRRAARVASQALIRCSESQPSHVYILVCFPVGGRNIPHRGESLMKGIIFTDTGMSKEDDVDDTTMP